MGFSTGGGKYNEDSAFEYHDLIHNKWLSKIERCPAGSRKSNG